MILRLKCDLHTTHSREVNTSGLLTSREAGVSLWLLMWCISERNRLWGQKTQKWAWLYTHGVSGGRQWFGSAGPMTYGARPRGVIETVGCDSLTVCRSTAESSSSSRRRCWARRPQTTLCNWGVLLKSVTVPRTSLTDDLGLKHCRELLVTFGSPYVTSHKHNAAAAAAAPLTTAKSQRKHKNFILIKFLSSRRVQTAAICIYIVCSRRCVEDTLTFTV